MELLLIVEFIYNYLKYLSTKLALYKTFIEYIIELDI